MPLSVWIAIIVCVLAYVSTKNRRKQAADATTTTVDDLLKGLDPNCQALNEICGRVEQEVAATGLRGKAALNAEMERLAPLLASHRATYEICRVFN